MFKDDIVDLVNNKENDLTWVWAVHSQLNLLYMNDAVWIEDAKNGWKDESFVKFLINYSLLRGKKGSNFSGKSKNGQKNREKFIHLCNENYRSVKCDADWEELSQIWLEVCRKLQENIESKPSFVPSTTFMPSATLKAFWFYQPKMVPMYDAFVKKALSRWAGSPGGKQKAIVPPNFMKTFGEFYKSNEENIEKAQKMFVKEYPYKPRVADKVLWLLGSEDKEAILNQFRAGIRIHYAV